MIDTGTIDETMRELMLMYAKADELLKDVEKEYEEYWDGDEVIDGLRSSLFDLSLEITGCVRKAAHALKHCAELDDEEE